MTGNSQNITGVGSLSATSLNALTLTAQAVGFTIAGGTTSKTLTVDASASISALAPLASPTFTGTVTIPSPFTLEATSVTSTGTQLNYLSAATGTTGTTSTNLVFSTSPTFATSITTPLVYGSLAASGNLTLRSTSDATKGYVILADDGGNVGIGTTGPDYTLDVYGTLRVKGLSEVSDSFDDETKIATSTNITVSEGQVKLLKLLWVCGDNVTFTYKGSSVTYGTVLNATTGKCWMDRNLGASQVATAYNDSAAYGDLFQWGRLDDGHQTRTSATTSNLSSTDNPGHSNFILAPDSPYDWRSPQNNNLWQGVTGTNNPCPSGWRIPTDTELDNERASWSSQDYNGAFASPLKLTAGGYRHYSYGSLADVGSYGRYWSSTVSGTYARHLYFYGTGASMLSKYRAYGFSVRCVQD